MYAPNPRMTDAEFAKLGCSEQVVYIKKVTAEYMKERYPDMEGLPESGDLYLVLDAEGDAQFCSDKKESAIGHVRLKGWQYTLVN